MMDIKLIAKCYQWLGKEGRHYFRTLKKLTGTVSPVLKLKGRIPVYPVHFREGTQVRNWMREQPECKDWDCHDFDNRWTELIEEVLKYDSI